VVITPWHLYSSPDAIFYFLGGLGALLGPLFGVIFTDYYLIRRQRVSIEELYLDDPRSRYYYRRGWNPKALIAGGVAAVFSLFVAFYAPWKDWSAFSWFVGVTIAAVLYYAISARDIRQPELEDGNAHGATTTRPEEAQA
jgi:nucleobase:cation symporter-1, NCS1 family